MTPKLEKTARQAYIIDSLVKGKKLIDLVKELNVSYTTLKRDKADIGYLPIAEELINVQLEEIERNENPESRLRWRADLIGKLKPKQIEQKVEQEGEIKIIVELIDPDIDSE